MHCKILWTSGLLALIYYACQSAKTTIAHNSYPLDHTSWIMDSLNQHDVEDFLCINFILVNKERFFYLEVAYPDLVQRNQVAMNGLDDGNGTTDIATLSWLANLRAQQFFITRAEDENRYTILEHLHDSGQIHLAWNNRKKSHDRSTELLDDISEFWAAKETLGIYNDYLASELMKLMNDKGVRYTLSETRLVLEAPNRTSRVVFFKKQ